MAEIIPDYLIGCGTCCGLDVTNERLYGSWYGTFNLSTEDTDVTIYRSGLGYDYETYVDTPAIDAVGSALTTYDIDSATWGYEGDSYVLASKSNQYRFHYSWTWEDLVEPPYTAITNITEVHKEETQARFYTTNPIKKINVKIARIQHDEFYQPGAPYSETLDPSANNELNIIVEFHADPDRPNTLISDPFQISPGVWPIPTETWDWYDENIRPDFPVGGSYNNFFSKRVVNYKLLKIDILEWF